MSKEIRINVRTTEEIKRDLEITARLKGLTVSSLINSLAVIAIREEKDREPRAFEKTTATKANQKAATSSEVLYNADDENTALPPVVQARRDAQAAQAAKDSKRKKKAS